MYSKDLAHDTEYTLVAIIMYAMGHYTAVCPRFGDQWYFFDDATVIPLPSETMQELTNKGYFENKDRKFVPRMLFYERTSLFERQSLAHSLHNLSHELNTFSAIMEKGK